MQIVPDSHSWTSIEMLLHFLEHYKNGGVSANYLIIGLQNTCNNGYQLTTPLPTSDAKEQIENLLHSLQTTGGIHLISPEDCTYIANECIRICAASPEKTEGVDNFDGWELVKNVHHESGSPTYEKKDKHGFTTYATKEMIMTPLQEILKKMTAYRDTEIEKHGLGKGSGLNYAINIANELVEKEKQMAKDFFQAGRKYSEGEVEQREANKKSPHDWKWDNLADDFNSFYTQYLNQSKP